MAGEIEIEIDGKKLSAKPNQTVIQVADEAGIYIPRFCYHKNLSIPANCRMCLVEIEKAPKPAPACSTPVMAGMKVFTKSPKTIAAQRSVMEFLLINHPLDCPICDQGGECELQDLSMGYGSSQSRYTEPKRAVADQDLGPLIATEMTRCIYCTRCVRFGDEIGGVRELGALGRGEFTEISTYIQHAIQSEVSGNIIDLCPVGALTSKPFRFTARAWELDQTKGISPHDCMGSNLHIHSRYGKIMRVVPDDNFAINEVWLSDRDRFSYTGLYHPERLEEPMALINGTWQAVDWEQALTLAAAGLRETIVKHGADKLGALISPNATVEECYLLQKIVRGLDSPHIDHRLREVDTRDQTQFGAYPGLNSSLAELEESDAIILIGSHLPKEQPIAALRVRKAQQKGATVIAINPVRYRFNFATAANIAIAPQHLAQFLQACIAALKNQDQSNPQEAIQIAQLLQNKQRINIILGAQSLHHSEAATIRSLAYELATLTKATFNILTEGANGAGAWLAGAIPHRQAGGVSVNHQGLNAYEMLEKPRKAYLLLNVEPEFDCANAYLAKTALQQTECVVAISMYKNPLLAAHAKVILPLAAFTETSGTYVNALGIWQSFNGAGQAFGASRPGWKILRALGNFLQLEGFEYESSHEVRNEVKVLVDKMPALQMQLTSLPSHAKLSQGALVRIGEVPIYAVDSLVRRAQPLQKMQNIMLGDIATLRLHPETAERLHLQTKDSVRVKQQHAEATYSVAIDPEIAQDAVWIAGGIPAAAHLGGLSAPVVIEKVS